MEKKGLFSGWKDVFSFTATQELKGGKYKASTIIIGIIIALIAGAISVIMALTQLEDKDEVEVENDFLKKVTNVYLIENEIIQDDLMNALVTTALSLEGAVEEKIEVQIIAKEEASECASKDKALVVELADNTEKDKKAISFNAVVPEGDKDRKDVAEEYLEYVLSYINMYGTTIAGVQVEDMPYFAAPYSTQATSVNDKVQNIAAWLMGMIGPMMLASLLMTMIILYGQNITKVVCAEKSSKLMEMILTSVKPYALITGKILASVTLALSQVLVWILCGFGGYIIGNKIADVINPNYVNYVDSVIDLISASNGASAFTWYSAVLSLVFIALGFLLYSVFAGLLASTVSKIEDLSSVTSLYQFPVMLGWLGSYLLPLIDNKTINTVIHLFPITSPFIVPGNILIGKCGIIEAMVSLIILIVTTIVCILLTGKIYRNKLFYRK